MRRLTIQDARRLAISRGLRFLSSSYLSSKAKYTWGCKLGHIWEATYSSIKSGSGCRKCWNQASAGKHLLLDGISQGDRIAQSMGGVLLSRHYQTSHAPMEWECINGHRWMAALGDVKKGSWCPSCHNFQVKERYCRAVLEEMFGKSFYKARPTWLVNSSGNRMEFDGFCPDLGIAFEYHGEYHYQQNSFFHPDSESLLRRQKHDSEKRHLCRERGVFLVEVPYHVPPLEMADWVKEDLLTQGFDFTKVQVSDVGRLQLQDTRLEEVQFLARAMGGECLSSAYLGVMAKHRFRCAQGHEWEAVLTNVKAGSWCFFCKGARIAKSKINPRGAEDMQALAASRHGRFESEEYLGVNRKHEWSCSRGHRWQAAPTDIKRGTWCPVCWKERTHDYNRSTQALLQADGGQSPHMQPTVSSSGGCASGGSGDDPTADCGLPGAVRAREWGVQVHGGNLGTDPPAA